MTMTTKTGAQKRVRKKDSFLPPSAGVTNVAGRDFIIMPLDDFEDWREDLALSALVEERIREDGPYISLEELESRLDKRDKERGK